MTEEFSEPPRGDSVLSWTFYDITLWEWLIAIAAAGGCYLALIGIFRLTVASLHRLARRTSTQLDDMIADVLNRTAVWFKAYLAIYFGAQTLTLTPQAALLLRNGLVVALSVQVAIWGNRLISDWLIHFIQQRQNGDPAMTRTMAGLLGFLGRLALISALLLVCLQNLGVEIDALLAGLGIGGVAVALSVQNVLGDLFASLSILLDRPFLVGDFIILDNGMMGNVEHVGLKTTRIRAISGEELVVNNNDILKSRIQNLRQMQKRMVNFTIRVAYQTPLEKLEAIPALVKSVIDDHPRTAFEWATLMGFGTYAFEFDVAYYVLNYERYSFMAVRQEIYLAILRRFEAEGVQLAYPTQTLLGELPSAGGRSMVAR